MPKLKLNSKLLPLITKSKPIKVVIGGRGCVHKDTLIDTPSGKVKIKDFAGGLIYSFSGSELVLTHAEKPIKYPQEKLYKINFANGNEIICTDQHRFLTVDGWRSLSCERRLKLGQFVFSPPRSTLGTSLLELHEDAQHCLGKLLNFLYCCLLYHHQYDPQPQQKLVTYLDVFQQLGDALQHDRCASYLDDQGLKHTYILSIFECHLSSLGALLKVAGQNCEDEESCIYEKLSELSLICQQSHEKNSLSLLIRKYSEFCLDLGKHYQFLDQTLQTVASTLRGGVDDSSFSDSISFDINHNPHYTEIKKISYHSTDNYYDFFVPYFNNYLSCGVINHNSGKSIGISDCLIMDMQTKALDLLCLREFQDSISDSVHRVLSSSITERLNVKGWEIQANKIITPAGNITSYKGAARNPDSIQSLQYFLRAWFEEAHTASKASLTKIIPTILRNPGAEIWFSANPQSSADPFSQRFIVPYLEELEKNGYYEDELHLIIVVNWRDNPWWNDDLERIRSFDFENLPRAEYDWIWEGKFNDSVDGSIIKAEWFDAAIDAHKLDRLQAVFKPHGAKVAAHDPFDDGDDAGGYCLRHGSIIERVLSKTSGEIDEVCDWATGNAIQDGADWFVWDGDGMGTGLKRQVSDAFKGTKANWHMFRGSLAGSAQDNAEKIYMREEEGTDAAPKKYKETFKNNRAQYYIDLANRFYNTYKCVEKGEYIAPEDMISLNSEGIENIVGLRSQLCRIPRKPNANGLEQIMSKEEMKKLKIKSPNEGDSVMMSLFAPKAASVGKKIKFSNWG